MSDAGAGAGRAFPARLLRDLALLAVIALPIAVGFSLLARRVASTTMDLQDRALERRRDEIGTLVLGDSHAQGIHYALVDDALHIASPGESVIHSYYRLRRILEDRPARLHRIVLSIGVHSLLETKRSMTEVAYWARVVDFRELAARSDDPWPMIVRGAVGSVGFMGEGAELWQDSRDAFRRWRKGEPPRTWEDRLRRWDGPASTPDLSQRSAGEIEMLTRRAVRAHVAFGARFDPLLAGYLEDLVVRAREAGLAVLIVEMPVTRDYLERMAARTDVAAHDRFVSDVAARHGADLLDLRDAFDDPALFTDPEHVSPCGRSETTRRVRLHLGLPAGPARPCEPDEPDEPGAGDRADGGPPAGVDTRRRDVYS